jgi:pterin-4a-carbinolamine dehydratase
MKAPTKSSRLQVARRQPKAGGRVGLTAQQLRRALRSLANWRVETSLAPGEAGRLRTELTRSFAFPTFGRAIKFMARAVPHIDATDHHPRWQNVYDTVTVWLSTHDLGGLISSRDVALARYLEGVFAEFLPGGAAKSPSDLFQDYLTAYNAMDVSGMLKPFADTCVFENFSGGKLTARTEGKAQLRALARRSLKAFASREQRVISMTASPDRVLAEIDYHAILQADLSPELKAGSELKLRGVTVAECSGGKIVRLSDYS